MVSHLKASPSLARAHRVVPLAALSLALACGVALADGDPVPDPPLPYIENISIGRAPCDTCAPIVCAGEPVQVTVSGHVPPCVEFRGLHEGHLDGVFQQVVVADFVVDTCRANCPQLVAPFTGGASLPPELAGRYGLTVLVRVRGCPDTSVVADSSNATVGYSVTDCPPPPIPPDSLVRSFVKLATVPANPCAGDSVTLQLIKNPCPPCVHLTSFGAGPDSAGHARLAGALTWAPACLELACQAETLSTRLGRFAQGSYHVDVAMTAHVLGTANPDSVIAFPLPLAFEVGPTCSGPPGPCVMREMQSDVPPGACALTLAPGGRGTVPLYYSSDLAMAGAQGTIQMPVQFQLTDLQLASGLTGVHLSRQKDGLGMRWLVFTDPGVTLPVGPHQHLLDATVTADPGALNGASGVMNPVITLASGPDGSELPFCIRRSLVVIAVRLCIAGEPSLCDVNHDGRLDVRDLVTMVSCLVDSVPHKGGNLGPCVDCNQDSTFDISDIFCCARAILRGPFMPPDSVRQDTSVSVSIGPVWAAGADRIVHVRVTGAHALGAANLRLDYPADRWRAGLRAIPLYAARPADADWYPLVDFDDAGHVYLGALRLGDSGADVLDVELLMQSTAPALSGDRLVAVGADLAAKDGSVVTPRDPLPTLSLTAPAPPEPGPGQPASLALSAPRPNPFTANTSFEVALPSTARIELAVHDLAGRRVATLASGVYTSGRWVFQWDGAGARGGVYFVRLSVNGEVRSTRVALLRNSQ